MKIKQKARDFRVRELLRDDYLRPRGRYRIYRVTKTKLTSLEAAATLADMAGVAAGEIGIAGLKDRQGVTTQYMSVASKKPVFLRTPSLRIEPVGFAERELTSEASTGNAFELTLRGVSRASRAELEKSVEAVREQGVPNYFGEQRFGNLRYNQGWIARDLALGEHERALRELLSARSENDNEHSRKFKAALAARWGDWRACRDIAGKFGAHHSVFEHLARNDGDFAGAFRRVATRVRLIHLYAWQSHLWNRAVARYIESVTNASDRIEVATPEGRLFFSTGAMSLDPTMQGVFRLPGEQLADVVHERQRELLAEALAREGLRPEQFRISGVPGFQLKGEDRALAVRAGNLRVAEQREHGRWESRSIAGARLRLSFDLPRGAYATIVLQRLLESERAPRRREDADERFERGRRDDGDKRARFRGDSASRPHSRRDGPPRSPDERPRGRRIRSKEDAREPRSRPRREDAHAADRTAPRPRARRGESGPDRKARKGTAHS